MQNNSTDSDTVKNSDFSCFVQDAVDMVCNEVAVTFAREV